MHPALEHRRKQSHNRSQHLPPPHLRFNACTAQEVNPLQITYSVHSYVAPVCSSTCPANYLKLQVIQSKGVLVIGNYARRTPTPQLHDTLNTDAIPVIIYRFKAKFFAHSPSPQPTGSNKSGIML